VSWLGIEPAIKSDKSSILTTTPPSHLRVFMHISTSAVCFASSWTLDIVSLQVNKKVSKKILFCALSKSHGVLQPLCSKRYCGSSSRQSANEWLQLSELVVAHLAHGICLCRHQDLDHVDPVQTNSKLWLFYELTANSEAVVSHLLIHDCGMIFH